MIKEKFVKPCIPELRGLARAPRHLAEKVLTDQDRSGQQNYSIYAGYLKCFLEDWPRDFMRIYDVPGLVSDMLADDNSRMREGARDIIEGDDDAADEIEKMISRIEANRILTLGVSHGTNVSGAVPIVPEYLAGNPFNMRTRKTEKNGRGPVAIFLELTTSGGFGNYRFERIASMMAFARQLILVRPVELWLILSFGGEGRLLQTSIRLETNPIDLSETAALLAHVSELNFFGREKTRADAKDTGHFRHSGWDGWAYRIPALERRFSGEILGRVMSPGSQIAYIPASLWGVDDLDDVDGWIDTMLKRFAPFLFEGVDREDDEMESALRALAALGE